MAKQIEGVSERILACAKEEFLNNGYKDASLRVIAAAADTSTNSIYVRFGDKEGLFSAIVEPVLSEMTERFLKIQEEFTRMDREAQDARLVSFNTQTYNFEFEPEVQGRRLDQAQLAMP